MKLMKNSMIPIDYKEDSNFYFVWKPAGIATSFGDQYSFLDEIIAQKPDFFLKLLEQFDKTQEYGLLNRLDNDTAGYIYFAKYQKIKEKYREMQDKKLLLKQYMCVVHGRLEWLQNIDNVDPSELESVYRKHTLPKWYMWFLQQLEITSKDAVKITIPIMHSKSSVQRMIAVKNQKDAVKWRGREHDVQTVVVPYVYDEKYDITKCVVYIQQGIRHQIRVHLSAIGHPIVWDALYVRGNMQHDRSWEATWKLQLQSVWFAYPNF